MREEQSCSSCPRKQAGGGKAIKSSATVTAAQVLAPGTYTIKKRISFSFRFTFFITVSSPMPVQLACLTA